jgi:aspartyl-tRNA synthetase
MTGAREWRRTHTCGELRQGDVGQEVRLNGWVAKRRNLGGIYFVDLRDRYGITQVLLEGAEERVGWDDEHNLSPEDVVTVSGTVALREQPNNELDTGLIEVRATRVEVLSRSLLPPFEIVPALDTNVDLRLQYRFLDLRRADMQRNLAHRSRFIGALRNAFLARGFVDVETPILNRATPEGARDYLVPSRVHPGKFYALPQSPQIFKQLLMVAGTDRYFQVARCFRDEDLRADRQPEFTQLDMEMSFVEESDVHEVWEAVLLDTFREALGVELALPFPRMRWREAMERFGSDKPDTRFGMELVDLAAWVPSCSFQVFGGALERGGRVMGLCVEGGGAAISRGAMKGLEKVAKEYGAQGLAWWKPGEEGGGAGPLAKFVEGDVGARLCELMDARAGDLLLFGADEEGVVWRALGALRLFVAKSLQRIPAGRWDFLWVTHFPMFEWDADEQRWSSSHHPFTAPQDWDLAGDPADMESRASCSTAGSSARAPSGSTARRPSSASSSCSASVPRSSARSSASCSMLFPTARPRTAASPSAWTASWP